MSPQYFELKLKQGARPVDPSERTPDPGGPHCFLVSRKINVDNTLFVVSEANESPRE